eukprot:TRINITY_DN1700_c0_g3_i1.p2 TRINITY_DN1700_c0_g3~~TRINITY_DN1700_c0_g3_i1.p2  ORF type:complete len:142 (-),score=22.73 TRINITY_DN1700_c0_g3_i1:454-879(-)
MNLAMTDANVSDSLLEFLNVAHVLFVQSDVARPLTHSTMLAVTILGECGGDKATSILVTYKRAASNVGSTSTGGPFPWWGSSVTTGGTASPRPGFINTKKTKLQQHARQQHDPKQQTINSKVPDDDVVVVVAGTYPKSFPV